MYYVTIRTKGGECVFGEVVENEMRLSPTGEIVQSCWLAIPEHFQKTSLDVYQVMPNHIHGIIMLGDAFVRTQHGEKEGSRKESLVRTRPAKGDGG